MAKSLNGTKTHQNLKDAFAGESQANRRYLYFAKVADVEGYPEIAGNFKETADGETGHAHGHLDYLEAGRRSGDGPADRQHREEPQGRHRRRDARVRDDVPGHGEDARAKKASTTSPSGSRRSRRPRRATRVASRRCSTRLEVNVDDAREASPERRSALPRCRGRFCDASSHDARSIPKPDAAARARPERRALLGRARSRGRAAARLRGLPRLPDVRELLRHRSRTCSRASIATSRRAAPTAPSCSTPTTSRASPTSAGSASSVTSSARTRRTRGTSG